MSGAGGAAGGAAPAGGPASLVSLAATGLSAGSQILAGDTAGNNAEMQGEATYFNDTFQAGQLGIDASYGEAKASQTDTYMRNQLQTTLQNINAVRASTGTGAGSPTEAAIENRTEQQSDQAREIRMQNINAQVSSDLSSAALARASGIQALMQGQANQSADQTSGLLGGLGSLAKGLAGAIPGLSSMGSGFMGTLTNVLAGGLIAA